MNKEELYQQIKGFKQTLAGKYYKDIKEIDTNKGFYYVDDKNAEDKAGFIGYLIEKKNVSNKYKNILDLTFGSGNLTSHIIFNNDIKYKQMIFNDLNTKNTNQKILTQIDNSKISEQNILDADSFNGNEGDLIIINPQIGGSYDDGNILKQKTENETDKNIYNKLEQTLLKFINNGKTILFYEGKSGDFKSVLQTIEHYAHYKGELNDLYVIAPSIINKLCFEKNKNDFIECVNNVENEDEVESFDDIEVVVDTFDEENKNKTKEEKELMVKEVAIEQFTDKSLGSLHFPHKNLLLKGVPGTGKSHTIEDIIEHQLDMSVIKETNLLRINIHSASSNSDLMQGISISTDDKSNILYKEKRGAVLNHIFKAMFKPNQPFVLVLEEIQENSLNELIGDLIYLIEKDKRTSIKLEGDQQLSYVELFNKVNPKYFVELPNLVEGNESNIKMMMPNNLYVFCTSNYRDDKKVIEDNLLRRFDVVEIYPQTQVVLGEEVFKSKDVSDFLELLNNKILKKFETEIHPDRYLVGHANWLDITEADTKENRELFYTALLKVVVEFKEIREVDFDTYTKEILEDVLENSDLSEKIKVYIEACKFEYKSYKEMVEKLQKKIYDFLK